MLLCPSSYLQEGLPTLSRLRIHLALHLLAIIPNRWAKRLDSPNSISSTISLYVFIVRLQINSCIFKSVKERNIESSPWPLWQFSIFLSSFLAFITPRMASNYFLNNHVSWVLRKFEKFAPYYVFQISFSSILVHSLLSFHLGSAKNSFSNWVLNSSVFCSLQLTLLRTLFGFINEVSAGLPFNASLASWPPQTPWRLGAGGCEGRVGEV